MEREIRELKRRLKEMGLTDKQIEAGISYYLNFCKKFEINVAKSARMIAKMIANMREAYKKMRECPTQCRT